MKETIKILYVEDDKSVIAFVKILFKKQNIDNVTYALNGKEAFEQYAKNEYDLVITYMIIQIINGFELIEAIKKINNKQIFMMVTGMENREDLIKAIELRVDFFIEKPIKPKKFIKVLEESISLCNQRKDFILSNLLLNQYKHAIDTTAILSKADLKGKITYVNEAFCDISQYTKEELIGKSHNIVRDPNMSANIFKDMWIKLLSKNQWKGIVKNRAKDGSQYIVDTVIFPLLGVDGNIIEYIAINHDITQLELYKTQLQKELAIAVKDIEETQKEVVFTMGSIGETRSKETGLHVKRVAEYSYLLAILYGIPKEEAEILKMASPMHDIGKVGIPDDILNKPGKLTFEEFEIMKTHSELGYEMLKGSTKEILRASAIVAHEHHEKYNGKGYPRGLKGEEIHIYGRITALCDVFDALGSDRVYKKSWELEKILNLFQEESGEHFDKKLVSLFFDNLDKFLEIRDRYKDK